MLLIVPKQDFIGHVLIDLFISEVKLLIKNSRRWDVTEDEVPRIA